MESKLQITKYFQIFKSSINNHSCSPRMLVTTGDYLLGIGDVAGELMRYAMNSVAAGLTHVPFEVILFLREMLACECYLMIIIQFIYLFIYYRCVVDPRHESLDEEGLQYESKSDTGQFAKGLIYLHL